MNPLFKLLGVENSFTKFDQKVKTIGWSGGCTWLLNNLGIQYEFKNNNIWSKWPVIIYSNHPTGLDPYLLTSALRRNDCYFWGDIYHLKKGKEIAKHIIPIAPKPFWTIVRRLLTNWPGYIYMRLTTPALSKEKTKEINRKAFEKTIELLKKGNQIIIFPSGGEYEFLSKKNGLTKVISECKRRKIKVNIYEIKIKKFGELSLFFHFVFKTKICAVLSYTEIK